MTEREITLADGSRGVVELVLILPPEEWGEWEVEEGEDGEEGEGDIHIDIADIDLPTHERSGLFARLSLWIGKIVGLHGSVR